MPFRDQDLQAVKDHLTKHAPDSCSICGGTSWTDQPDLGAVVTQHDGGVNMLNTLQVLQLVCDNCGYVVMFDAEKVGVDIDVKLKRRR